MFSWITVMVKQMSALLRAKIIPWAAQSAHRNLIVARPQMSAAALPEGATLSRRKIQGQRVPLKAQRQHGNQRLYIAEWPEANLHEIAPPKLACVVSGAADYLLGNYSLHCGEGNFILIPPRAPHQRSGPFLQEAQRPGGSCVLLQAYAYSHGVLLWLSHSNGEQHINRTLDNYLVSNIAAVQILHLLMEEAIKGEDQSELVCHHFLAILFTMLARDLEAGRYLHPGPKRDMEVPVRATAGFAEQVRSHIEANPKLKAEDAAAKMYVSYPQFSRRIRQETGVTFGELRTRCRLERGQELLRETDLTATTIALCLGLESANYFQELFHRRIGCTPIEYRRAQRKPDGT